MNHSKSRLSPEFALLGFLYKAPSHGYELHQRLKNEFSYIWHASQSQTYNILKRLENHGDIHSTLIDKENAHPRQLLSITPTGSERFESWLMEPTQASVHAIRVEFITRLYFIQLYFPERSKVMVQDQMDVLIASADQLRRVLVNLPEQQVFNRMALELRLELLVSVIHWLDGCNQSFKR